MRDLPRAAQVYIFVLCALAIISLLAAGTVVLAHPEWLLSVAGIAALIAFLDLFPVIVREHEVETTISTAVKISGLLMFDPSVLITSVFVGTLLAELRLRRGNVKRIFNICAMTTTYTAMAFVYRALQGDSTSIVETPQNLIALAGLAISDLLLNSLTVSLVVALATRSSVRYIWSENFRPIILHDLSMVPLGAFITILWRLTPWSVVFAAIPLGLVHYSSRMVAELRRQTYSALMVIARMLEERDEDTHRHCEHVASHAVEIAHRMGLSQGEIEVIQRAAYLHDIGKIGMNNAILFKPSTLTPTETEKSKRHVVLGAELLQSFPSFERGALYVRHHHERWDGQGYPDGLRGEQIPLGARILCVADAYQAMIEDRAYRPAMSLDAALQEVARQASIQFDPAVVRALFKAQGVPYIAPQRNVDVPHSRPDAVNA